MGDIALATAKAGLGVVMFSLEMSAEELAMRFVSSEARIPSERLRSGVLTEKDWASLSRSFGVLAELPLYIDDEPKATLFNMRAKCRRLASHGSLGLIAVDYLQLMQGPRKTDWRQQEVADLSRGLKLMARELDVPVLCAAQLNRRVEDREDKRPQLSDIRESGAVEQDADIVIFLHRPEAYVKFDRQGEADVIVATHRNGPIDDITLAFLSPYTKFASIAKN